MELNKEFSIDEFQMAEKHLRKCLTVLVIVEMQIKATLRCHFTPVRMAKIKTQMTADADKVSEKEEYSCTLGRVLSWYNYCGNQPGSS